MPIIIDASVAVKLVADEDGAEAARSLLTDGSQRIAPDWMLVEVASGLANKARYEGLTLEQAQLKFEALSAFIDKFVPSSELIEAAMALAVKLDHALYDCLYLQVAIQEEGVVITADDGLVRSAQRVGMGKLVERLTW